MNFANNADIGCGPTTKPIVNVSNEKDKFNLECDTIHDQQGRLISGLEELKNVMFVEILIIGRRSGRERLQRRQCVCSKKGYCSNRALPLSLRPPGLRLLYGYQALSVDDKKFRSLRKVKQSLNARAAWRFVWPRREVM